MTAGTPHHTPLVYVECDVPDGQSLAEWRAARDAARRAGRRPRRHPVAHARRRARIGHGSP